MSQTHSGPPRLERMMSQGTMLAITRMPEVMTQMKSLNGISGQQLFNVLLNDQLAPVLSSVFWSPLNIYKSSVFVLTRKCVTNSVPDLIERVLEGPIDSLDACFTNSKLSVTNPQTPDNISLA